MKRSLRHGWNGKRVLRSAWLVVVISLCLLAAELGGLFSALDSRLSELRFASHSRAPTGDVVLVDIDARSIAGIGVWPWPRHLHADLLSAAAKAGAAKVAFDIDFSSASTEAEDNAFAAALSDAGVETYLATFAQPATAGDKILQPAMPIEKLLRVSWPVSVDVPLDPDGVIRRFPYSSDSAGERQDSMPSVLAGRDGGTGLFGIDYSIAALDVPRVSFVDLIAGRIDSEFLADKSLIVGASAVELHDFFTVPVFGTVSGSLVLALATETLLQGRELTEQPIPAFCLGIFGLLAFFSTARLRTGPAVVLLVMAIVCTEVAALALQQYGSVVIATARLDSLALASVVWTLLREFDLGRIRVWIARIQAANSHSMLERVIDESFDGIVILSRDGAIARVNAEAAALLNVRRSALRHLEDLPNALCQSIRAAIQSATATGAPEDRALRQMTLSGDGADGGGRVLEYTIAPFWMKGISAATDGTAADVLHLCLTLRDVTIREQAQKRMRYLALHDSLTGLGNRRSLEEAIAELGTGTEASGVALLAFDLDRFKAVNDALGHATGDAVLVETARRARKVFGARAFHARIGGDEFAVLLDSSTADQAVEAASRFLHAVNEPYNIRGHRISIGTSVGIGWWPSKVLDASDMMRQADLALYRAKVAPSERVAVFESGMEVDRMARLSLEQDIEGALDKGEFELVYQPQVILDTAQIIGAEALIRWRHPLRGYVSPAAFIPVAEEMGHIHSLGAFVLEVACREATHWPRDVKIAVNVSALQFEAGDIVGAVRRALVNSGLEARRLELEITESAFATDTDRLRETFTDLLALGVSFALDDYGTGFSSLGYLHRFPISKIKIDRSFVTDAPTSSQSMAVLRSIITLGDGLKIRTIAEGIETIEQAQALRAIGCTEGQGYLYSKPISSVAFRTLVTKRPTEPESLLLAAS
ncbi:EAL domain-containing protein [Aureimonas glaciei]|uniref:EAL domain-containing protein n=1 Tax=Aureimonas glaciei TaxID=1776957 RepID=A0A917DB92_9HYPH|nr:EAL domain-containing protein [Aureimonas glaciei]GGD21849.1 hypothetical protein GCM10011335_26010 [Aureimonas glaciei]